MRNLVSFVFVIIVSFVLGIFVEQNFQVISNVKQRCIQCQNDKGKLNQQCVCDKCTCCNGCPGKCGNCPCSCDVCDCCVACSGHGKKPKQKTKIQPKLEIRDGD